MVKDASQLHCSAPWGKGTRVITHPGNFSDPYSCRDCALYCSRGRGTRGDLSWNAPYWLISVGCDRVTINVDTTWLRLNLLTPGRRNRICSDRLTVADVSPNDWFIVKIRYCYVTVVST